jgi:hypothetical protein
MDSQEIEEQLIIILRLQDGKLMPERLREMCLLVKAAEPGIALENLCDELFEWDISISKDVLNQIISLGQFMGINEKYWKRLPIQ